MIFAGKNIVFLKYVNHCFKRKGQDIKVRFCREMCLSENFLDSLMSNINSYFIHMQKFILDNITNDILFFCNSSFHFHCFHNWKKILTLTHPSLSVRPSLRPAYPTLYDNNTIILIIFHSQMLEIYHLIMSLCIITFINGSFSINDLFPHSIRPSHPALLTL